MRVAFQRAREQRSRARRGSVLMPVVAAMLLMLLTGTALSELFGAQRIRSLLAFEAAQARWSAEAGIWHAAYLGDEITTPIGFGGGSYTVTRSGDLYTGVGVLSEATQTVSITLRAGGGGSASFPQPVAHWAFEETSGSTVSDSIGSNDGTAYNGMSWGAGGAPGGGSAAQFDGTNDVVVVPHSSTFVLDEMTLQFWFRADGLGGYRDLVSKDSSGRDNGGQFSVYLWGDNVVATLESTSSTYVLDSGSRISSSTWHHVAFVVGSGGMRLYVDGVARDFDSYAGGLGTSSGGSGNTEPMAFGAWTGASGNGTVSPLYDHFDGRMDAIAFYGVALSADQVATLYAGGGVLP